MYHKRYVNEFIKTPTIFQKPVKSVKRSLLKDANLQHSESNKLVNFKFSIAIFRDRVYFEVRCKDNINSAGLFNQFIESNVNILYNYD